MGVAIFRFGFPRETKGECARRFDSSSKQQRASQTLGTSFVRRIAEPEQDRFY
jgi:hypothetical protein